MSASGTDAVLLQRIERVIGLMAPLLDLLLAAGDRISRVLDPDDPDYAPPRMARHGDFAPRGLSALRVPEAPGERRASG